MFRFQSSRRVQIDTEDVPAPAPRYDGETLAEDGDGGLQLRPSGVNVTEDLEPFMGVKVRRKASRLRDYMGDYLDVQSRPYIMKILEKQGDRKLVFADKVLKFTGTGKLKRRILLITDFAIYIVDPDTDTLKRRIALAAVEKLCLSELNDNFFAIIIPTEYDLLMASTRKTEIVTVLLEATKSASDYELEVSLANRFEYNAAANVIKEIQFSEVEGDRKLVFADKVLKFTGTGKLKRRILLITDFAIYIVDPDTDTLKRRIALAAVEKLCLSELNDNFFAIIIPTEYDLLMASTRKTEIVTVLLEATKSASDYELEVSLANKFEYNAAANVIKEIQFSEVEGGVRTRIVQK